MKSSFICSRSRSALGQLSRSALNRSNSPRCVQENVIHLLYKSSRRIGVIFLSLASFCLPLTTWAAGPQKVAGALPYERSSNEFASAIVLDAKTGQVLYEYKADRIWSAASLTKLMGALVFMDHHPNWNTVISLLQQDEVGGGRLRVASGARLTVRDLLYSSITASANNAATALARVSGLGISAFVKAMNKKAAILGLKSTTFVDPSGIEPKNVTTAREMAIIAGKAFDMDAIRRPATTAHYRFVVRNTGQVKNLTNTNDLLVQGEYDDVYVMGGKTGFLYESMYNLAVRIKPMNDEQGKRSLMIVVFGSPDRPQSFRSAHALAKWAWKAYTW